MIVFKSYFRMAKKLKGTLVMPLVVFAIMLVLIGLNTEAKQESFKENIPPISIINQSGESIVLDGLLTYLEGKVEIVDLHENQVEDAIFHREIFLSVTLPKGFESNLNAVRFENQLISDSSRGYIAQKHINDYFDYYSAYVNQGVPEKEAIQRILESKNAVEKVQLHSSGDQHDENRYVTMFLNSQTYTMTLAIMSIITTLLIRFNEKKVLDRSRISSMSTREQSKQLLVGTLVVGHAVWLGMTIIGTLALWDKLDLSIYGYFILNSYVFFIAILSLSYMLSKMITSVRVQNAVVNSVTLGIGFISGAFVPVEFIDQKIISFAKLFPVYWNIEANNYIGDGNIGFQSIGMSILIQVTFAITAVCIAMLIARYKANTNK